MAPGKVYQLQFKEVETAADPESGTFNVTLTMPKPDDLNLFPGMAATVVAELVLDQISMIQKIPSSAIFDIDNMQYVWLVDKDNILSQQNVVVNENGALVSGLNDCDIIVAAGGKALASGQKIREWVKERGL